MRSILPVLAVLASVPAAAQYPLPGAAPPGMGRPAIDPFTASPGVTRPDVPQYDPVTGMPTQARRAARGRGAIGLERPGASVFVNPMTPGVPGQAPRAAHPGAPPPIDPMSSTPGVQQMRPGTYDTYAAPTGIPPAAAPAAPTYGYGSIPTGTGIPGGGAGVSLPQYDPFAGRPDDKYSYGRR